MGRCVIHTGVEHDTYAYKITGGAVHIDVNEQTIVIPAKDWRCIVESIARGENGDADLLTQTGLRADVGRRAFLDRLEELL